MASNENLIPIPGRLHSVATEGHISGADEIYDDTQQKDQETINSELIAAVGAGGSVDSRIAAAVNVEKTRAEGAESTLDGKITAEQTRATNAEGALDGRVDTLEEAVGTGGSVDSRISSAVNAAKSEIKGNATSACDTLGEAEALISAEATRAQAAESNLNSGKADKATTLAGYGITDAYTKTETYTKTEVNGLVDTPHQEYVTVDAYASLPAAGSKDTIYRVSNYDGSTSQVDASVYSEYAWDGTQYVFLCVKSAVGEVFDISVYNNNAKYADLATALNGGANIPQSLQKGGMSVKFVQSSDNKYVQYFCNSQNFTIDVTAWEKQNLEKELCGLSQDFDMIVLGEQKETFSTNGYNNNVGFFNFKKNILYTITINSEFTETLYCEMKAVDGTTLIPTTPITSGSWSSGFTPTDDYSGVYFVLGNSGTANTTITITTQEYRGLKANYEELLANYNKVNNRQSVSVTRGSVTINGNNITLGAGEYYFYNDMGTQSSTTLDSAATFEVPNDGCLVYNRITNEFSVKTLANTIANDLILLFKDGDQRFKTYGTLWSGLLSNNNIAKIESLLPKLYIGNIVFIQGGYASIDSNRVLTLFNFDVFTNKYESTRVEGSKTVTLPNGTCAIWFKMSTKTLYVSSSGFDDDSVLIGSAIYSQKKITLFGVDKITWADDIEYQAILQSEINEINEYPDFVKTAANNTYERFLKYIDGATSVLGQITDVHTQGITRYRHIGYFSNCNKLFGFNVMVNGGDIGLDVGETESVAYELIGNTKSMMRNALWLFCKGNHEYGTQQISNLKINNAFNAPFSREYQGRIHSVLSGNSIGYGYTDDEINKVRYIYLNTSEGDTDAIQLSSTQLSWFISILGLTQADYRVVVLTHVCPSSIGNATSYPHEVDGDDFVALRGILESFVAKTSGSSVPMDISWDFTNVASSTKLVCVLSGHSHFNNNGKINGVNYIVRQGYGNISASEIPEGGTRDEFNWQSQCLFDVLAVKNDGNAKIFRIGAGDSTRDLEITY